MKNSLSARTIRTVIRRHPMAAVFLVVASILSVVLSLLPPLILKQVIDGCIMTGDFTSLVPLAVGYAAVFIAAGGANFAQGWLLAILGQNLIRNLRMAMMEKLERMRTSYYTGNTPAAVSGRFINDVESVSDLFTDGVVSMAVDSLKIIGVLISISLFSAKLALVTLVLIPIIYFITRFFQKNVLAAQTRNLAQLGSVNSHISETLHCFSMIRIFCAQSYMERLYTRKLAGNYRTKAQVNLYDSLYSPIIQVLRALSITVIALGSAGIGLKLGLSVGLLAASVDYITSLLDPIESLGDEFQSIQSGISGLRRIDEFAAEPEREPGNPNLKLADVVQSGIREIRYDHLSFAYDPQHPVLQDFNLRIAGGTTAVLTGRTGIGKTTLFNLTAGVLRPDSGSVSVNGISTAEMPDAVRRRLFGYIEQNFTFVSGDVIRQITLGDPAISAAQAEEACRYVGLQDCILGLPKGYQTDVSDGGSFSWGQRQLLGIARALVSDPKILLLDEMSANLDAETEKNILSVLQKAKAGRTILEISHRTSAVLGDSQIITMPERQNLSPEKAAV